MYRALLVLTMLAVTVVALGRPLPDVGAITPIFVDRAATSGDNDGSSWSDAFTSLQTALAEATDSDRVYVASGTYTTGGTGFFLDTDAELYGGFAGTESSPAERDFVHTPPTILSGDAGVKGDITDNAAHVLSLDAFVHPVIDGFTITGGNAKNSGSGGGIEAANLNAQTTFRNLTIIDNRAASSGGGMYLDGEAILENVTFAGNTATIGGAIRLAGSDTMVFRNATFSGNHATGTGGAIYLGSSAKAYVFNGTFAGNRADTAFGGPGVYLNASSNAVFSGGDLIFTDSGQVPVTSENNQPTIMLSRLISDFNCITPSVCTSFQKIDDPKIGDLLPNGGAALTHALLAGSPAIDAGPPDPCVDTDARGVGRPVDGDGDGEAFCDYGAYEYVPPPSVQFTTATSTGGEDAGTGSATIELSRTYPADVTVAVGVGTGSAAEGTDFTAALGPPLTIPANTVGAEISFTILQDALDESDETAVFVLSDAQGAVLGARTAHTRTIVDDDATPTIAFAGADSNGPESKRSPAIAVSLSAPSGRDVIVRFKPFGGSAKGNGLDYKLGNRKLMVPAGQTSVTIPLTVIDDLADEPTETVNLLLVNPVNAIFGPLTGHIYRINDDDKPKFCLGRAVTIYGTTGPDSVKGTAGADVIYTGPGSDRVEGLAGNDRICTGGGNDRIYGGPGADQALGDTGADVLEGDAGADILKAGPGRDIVRGEDGDDRLAGGPGAGDACSGGPGTDVLVGAHGCETTSGVP